MDTLVIEGLKKRFGDKEVLRGLNLAVPEHSIFGFVGKNGAGKTTTMKAVLGLIAADEGEITVCGERVSYGNTRTNRLIGYLPDVPEFYDFMSAEEYLRFTGEIVGMDPGECRLRGGELLSLVGLSGERHRIKGYSRGMKQRLGIASALLARPRLLIADEPTSALDPVGRREILDILSSLPGETTVLFSTHILSDVERICTDVAFLDGGVNILSGRVDTVKASYSTDEYIIVTESDEGARTVLEAFPRLKRTEGMSLEFSGRDHTLYELMHFISERRIAISSILKKEPSLETLFMEVAGK